MICSYIPGRIRLRSPRFREAETVAALMAILKDQPGLTGLENNLNTGSLLIRFDPEKVDQQTALAALNFLEEEDAGEQSRACCGCGACENRGGRDAGHQSGPAWDDDQPSLFPQNKEALEYAAMVGAFVICTASGFLRAKGWHIYSGLTLAGLTVQHLVKYRDRLRSLFVDS